MNTSVLPQIIYEFTDFISSMEIEYRTFQSMQDAEEIVNIQRQAWNMDDLGIVPTFETRAVADVGFVYIAELDGKAIGFIYGYHHFPDIHYSHMMAVLPEYHGQSVGYNLKKYHRNQILQSKYQIKAVQWTVDPLLPNNAYLNFAKLGGYCDTYKVNYYGDPDSDGVEIYAGVPTDRFKLTWPIHSDRVKRRMEDYKQDRIDYETIKQNTILNSIENNKFNGSTEIPQADLFFVEVPSNYQEIRRNQLDLAKEWREKFQRICLQAFDKDFIVADYHHVRDNEKEEMRNYYEFQKKMNFTGY